MTKLKQLINPLASLSRRERQIMDILIEARECSAQDVLARLPDPPSYSSVRSLIARLVEKDLVGFRTEGTRHIYLPKISQEKAQGSALQRLVKTFFKGSRSQAVSALLDMDDIALSSRELDDIERKIQRLKSISHD